MDDAAPTFHSRKPWLPLLISLLLFAGLSSLVLWQWRALESSSRASQEQLFALAVDGVELSVRERMRAYEIVLRGMAGLMSGSDQVSDQEWQRATDQLQLQGHYPGIQALAWGRYLRSGELSTFVDAVHATERKDYQVYPPGEREAHMVVEFINPMDWRNRRVLGSTCTARKPAVRPSPRRVTVARRCSPDHCGSSRRPTKMPRPACCCTCRCFA